MKNSYILNYLYRLAVALNLSFCGRWILSFIQSAFDDVIRKTMYCFGIAYLRNSFVYNKPYTLVNVGSTPTPPRGLSTKTQT